MGSEAQGVADQKGRGWEYALTAALLREWVGPLERRWLDLERGLYVPTKAHIPDDAFMSWAGTQMSNLSDQTGALNQLVNVELKPTWGPPGQPGSVEDIRRVCSYIADACSRLLEWEERVRGAKAAEPFSEMVDAFRGVAGPAISEIAKMPRFIDGMLSAEVPGEHRLSLEFSFPPDFARKYEEAMRHIREHHGIDEDDGD